MFCLFKHNQSRDSNQRKSHKKNTKQTQIARQITNHDGNKQTALHAPNPVAKTNKVRKSQKNSHHINLKTIYMGRNSHIKDKKKKAEE